MKDLNIYMFADNSYLTLLNDTIIPTLPPSFPAFNIVVMPGNFVNLPGNTHSSVYRDLMMFRLEKYLEILKTHKGAQVLFLDADVIIYGDFIDDLKQRLEKKDFLAQQHVDEKHFCAGIMAFNSNDKTIQFWKEAIAYCSNIPEADRQPGFPEVELNEVLGEKILQKQIDWFQYLPNKYGYIDEDSYMYHAVNGGNLITQKRYILCLADAICAALRLGALRGDEELVAGTIPFYSNFKEAGKKFLEGVDYTCAIRCDPSEPGTDTIDINGKILYLPAAGLVHVNPRGFSFPIIHESEIAQLLSDKYPEGFYLCKSFKVGWAPDKDIVFAYEMVTGTLFVNTQTDAAEEAYIQHPIHPVDIDERGVDLSTAVKRMSRSYTNSLIEQISQGKTRRK